jgi:hypothetical protein
MLAEHKIVETSVTLEMQMIMDHSYIQGNMTLGMLSLKYLVSLLLTKILNIIFNIEANVDDTMVSSILSIPS